MLLWHDASSNYSHIKFVKWFFIGEVQIIHILTPVAKRIWTFRTTKLRQQQKEGPTFANADTSSVRIKNYGSFKQFQNLKNISRLNFIVAKWKGTKKKQFRWEKSNAQHSSLLYIVHWNNVRWVTDTACAMCKQLPVKVPRAKKEMIIKTYMLITCHKRGWCFFLLNRSFKYFKIDFHLL